MQKLFPTTTINRKSKNIVVIACLIKASKMEIVCNKSNMINFKSIVYQMRNFNSYIRFLQNMIKIQMEDFH